MKYPVQRLSGDVNGPGKLLVDNQWSILIARSAIYYGKLSILQTTCVSLQSGKLPNGTLCSEIVSSCRAFLDEEKDQMVHGLATIKRMNDDAQDPTPEGKALPLIARHFKDQDGNPLGGVSAGPGFSITWQTGIPGRVDTNKLPTGAFVEDILEAAADRIEFYQKTALVCDAYDQALAKVYAAIKELHTVKALQAEPSATTA